MVDERFFTTEELLIWCCKSLNLSGNLCEEYIHLIPHTCNVPKRPITSDIQWYQRIVYNIQCKEERNTIFKACPEVQVIRAKGF
jgi:hypothetical protein